MRRREFIALIGVAPLTWPVVGQAQQRGMPVVGVLCAGTAQALEPYLKGFREGMRQLGYVDGSNVRLEIRGWLSGPPARFGERLGALQPTCDRFYAASGPSGGAKSDKRDPNRNGNGRRPSGLRIGGEPLPSRRQCDWPCKFRRSACLQADRLSA